MSHITSEYVDTDMNNERLVSKRATFFSMSDACPFWISYHLLKIVLFSSSDAGQFGSLVYYLFIECGSGGLWLLFVEGKGGGQGRGSGEIYKFMKKQNAVQMVIKPYQSSSCQ